MEARHLGIPGAWELIPRRHGDERGFFSETYNRRTLSEVGIDDEFVQDNHSLSSQVGVVRGMHFQIPPHPIAKLVRVTHGAILDVLVDLRHGSPSFGSYELVEVSAERWNQVYVPVGVAHGFCTLAPDTEVAYKVTDYWHPDVDRGLLWNDPDLAIPWPVPAADAIVSDKDRAQPRFSELPHIFDYDGGADHG